jgi:hypothetical protein
MMETDNNEGEARLALDAIDFRRRQVIAEIDMPWWYWWGVGLGWVALGVITDLKVVWASAAATLAFGAIHSAIAQRVLSGRHRSTGVSVRAELVSRSVPLLVFTYLIVMAGVTVGVAVGLHADGAGHPVTIASCFVAVAVICGGPNLMAAVRRRAERVPVT